MDTHNALTETDLQPAIEDCTEEDTHKTKVTNPMRVERRSKVVQVTPERTADACLDRAAVNGMTLAEILQVFGLPRRYLRGDGDHEDTTSIFDAAVLASRG